MQVIVSNEIVIQDPTQEVIDYCKSMLQIENPEYFKRLRMGFYLGDTPKILTMYRKDGNTYYLPYGVLRDIIKILTINFSIRYDLADNPPVNYNSELPLYEYQSEAVKTLASYPGILQAPCGSGKTQMGIALAILLRKKTLWLTHTSDLLKQSKDRAAQYINKNLIGTITAGKIDISEGITFATVQTMSKINLSEYKYSWDVVIVDECHRVAGTPTKIMMFSSILNALAAPYKYGLSATLHRSDGMIKSTFSLLGGISYVITDEAVSDVTMDVTVQEVKTGTEISRECLDTDGTLDYGKLLTYLSTDKDRSKVIVQKIIENKDHSNLILSDRLSHFTELIELLIEAGIPETQIRQIDGSMVSKKQKEARQKALEDMRSGGARFLFASYRLAKEGLDIPNLDRLYLASPVKDSAVVTQSIGRIKRTAEEKSDAICYDFVDNIGFCEGAWKQRRSCYKKEGCKILEVKTPAMSKTLVNFGFKAEGF